MKKMFQIIKVKNHVNITLLRIKFNILLKTFQKDREYFQKKYQSYEKAEDIPPAQGTLRLVQMANLKLLKDFDKICKTNGLQYWADFGTLLGAVRHKGFIPWDDDIDVSMMRDDYEKIIEAFEKYSRNKDIYAQFEVASTSTYRLAIKIRHKKCKHLFVDVFPDDFYGEHVTDEDKLKITKELKRQWKVLQKDLTLETPIPVAKDKFDNLRKRTLKGNDSNSDILMGIDFSHARKYWLYDNDLIFPLREIEYEGCNFPTVSKPKEYLQKLFGDEYMNYPDAIGFGHSSYLKLTPEENNIMQKLINNK